MSAVGERAVGGEDNVDLRGGNEEDGGDEEMRRFLQVEFLRDVWAQS